MSLLFTPPLLFALGLVGARLAKTKRVWHPHTRFPRRWLGTLVLAAYVVDLSLLLDRPWTAWLAWLPGVSGFDWSVNSGVLHFETAWPIASGTLFVVLVLVFASYPLWAWLGYVLGVMLWGRSPKQTGVMGLMR